MKRNKIKTIIQEKNHLLSKSGKQVGYDFDREIIHKFRVAVKTLRSFLRLLKAHSNDRRLSMPKKLKRIYLIAGEIRDAQLELNRIESNSLELPEYTEKLHLKINRQKKEWHKQYSKKIFAKFRKRLLSVKYETIHTDMLESFFASKMNSINELSKLVSPSDEQVHGVRKQAKDILYAANLAEKKWEKASKVLTQMPLAELDILSDAIGCYRDEKLQLEHLSSFTSATVGPAEESTIKNLCDENASVLLEEKIRITEEIKALNPEKRTSP